MPEPGSGSDYARAALAREAQAVASTPEGGRNDRLNVAAFSLAQLVAAGHLHLDDVRNALRIAASAAGLGSVEIEKTLHSGIRAGLQQPRHVPELTTGKTVIESTAEEIAGTAEPMSPAEASAALEAREIAEELRRIRVREAARAIHAAEKAGPMPEFDLDTLADVLARPPAPAARVEGLIPWESSTAVIAQRKTSKTTLALNYARSLLTGQNFLERFTVRPVAGNVAMLNYEVSAAQLARWAADAGIPAERFLLVNLRGRRNPLGLAEDRDRLAAQLRSRSIETLIVDPFGQAFTGTSQNDAGEVGRFLADLDRFARADVGALDLMLTAHAGWDGSRTRGSSALEDWADSIITLTRNDDKEGDGERYLRAVGRDVEVEEDRLHYDADTRTLTLAGSGSRRAARATRRQGLLDSAVLKIIKDQPGLNTTQLGNELRAAGVGSQRGEVGHSAQRLVDVGAARVAYAPRGANCYFPVTYPDVSRPIPAGGVTTYPDPSLKDGIGEEDRSGADLSRIADGQTGSADAVPTTAQPLSLARQCECGNTLENTTQQARGTCGQCYFKAAS